MRTDTLIKHDGFNAIFEKLDIVEAERFIALIKRYNFDYTNGAKHYGKIYLLMNCQQRQ